MTEDSQAPAANRMLGSQLVNKSIIRSPPQTTSQVKQQTTAKNLQQKQATTTIIESNHDNNNKTPSPPPHQQTKASPPNSPSKPQGHHHNTPTLIPKSSNKSPELKQAATVIATTEDGPHHHQHHHQQQVAASFNPSSSAKELQLLAKEAQDLKAKTRKLQLEVDEKNEIINLLKDEMETLREQNDKFHRDSIQLIKDSKRVKFLQDENDFLQDKVGQVEVLELEIKRLKERLNETEFFKLRVSELEEDLSKSREESNQFEDQWRQAESKLTRVAELESELHKWKSFSHELELEKNSIQSKLLESIDHEAKLDSDNKKVEDEVRRLRDLIKSYEEQRDEEQASNSLIMSVADLKQLDNQQQQQEKLLLEIGTNTESNTVQEMGQQTDISDTAEKSCETDHVELEQSHHQDDTANLQALNTENESLKDELKKQEIKLNTLVDSNKQIFNELDGNKRLISDLRQDLACEKSLTQKLTTQLTSFTKQIKSLDKQYFPMHDTKASITPTTTKTTTTTMAQKQQIDSEQQRSGNRSKLAEDVDWKQKSALEAASTATMTPTQTKDELPNGLVGAVSGTGVLGKISSPVHHVNGLKDKSPLTVDESQREQLAKKKVTTPATTITRPNDSSTSSKSNNTGRIDKEPQPKSSGVHDDGDEDESLDSSEIPRAPTPVKSYRSSERDNKGGNFVRNSIPSRSVNFGHSRSSTQLDRIRASVTATATTSSSNTSATSFNEQTTKNLTITTNSEQQAFGGGSAQKQGFVLNCMLNHHHSDRCFAKIERHTSPGQDRHNHLHHQHVSNHQNHHQAHHQTTTATNVASSRQLNALIDPVANEQLFMSMLQQQIAAQQQPGLPSAQQLSEQQIAHLNNLQRQHYYHHLHQLHQIHHLHQLHHLHHKCQQQQQQQQHHHQHPNHQTPQQQKSDPGVTAAVPTADIHANMVGSQFYAPSYDQVYANMMANNNSNQQAEHRIQRHNGTRLVNTDSDQGTNAVRQQQPEYKRISPQRTVPAGSVYHHQMSSSKLAQIDELTNNLPMGFDAREGMKKTNNQVRKQQQLLPALNQSPNASTMQRTTNAMGHASSQQRQQQSSPTMSSPSSSRTSSNISPSSEASSSSSTSSTNSLSTSVPLTRSALRHTATDLSRRQYSVERELINSTPLTATLSRVGSCRGVPSNHYHHLVNGQQQQTSVPKDINSLMRNPVQSQQPPMRTSKILNIGSQQQQQQQNNASAATPGQIDPNQLTTLRKEMKKTPNGVNSLVDSFNRPTANSMANMKLNDNLAFASLRVPKKSASGSNLNTSLIAAAAAAAATNGRSISSRVSSAASSPDKARLIKEASANSPASKKSSIGSGSNKNSNNNNNGHSSVWYEYGCI